MKRFGKIWRIEWLASAVVFIVLIALPQTVRAHGELEIQIAAITKQIQITTNNAAQLYLDRAELHREHKDWNAAKSDYDRAAQFDPNLTAVDFYRAKMLDDSGQLETARALFDKVLARSPKNGEAFISRARVLVKLGDRQSAIEDFQRGLGASPSPSPEHFLELAQTFVVAGKTNDALQTLDQGIKKFGPVVTLQLYTLELELGRKNNDAALARLDTIIERAERKENWHARRGDILLAADRPAEAQKSFEASLAAIKLLPSVLQKAPPMQNLQSRVIAALTEISTISVPNSRKNSVAELSD